MTGIAQDLNTFWGDFRSHNSSLLATTKKAGAEIESPVTFGTLRLTFQFVTENPLASMEHLIAFIP